LLAWLAATDRANASRTKLPDVTPSPTLAELGISKRESAEAQRLANLPTEKKEAVATGLLTKTQARTSIWASKARASFTLSTKRAGTED